MKNLYENKKPAYLPDFPSGLVCFNAEGKDLNYNNEITLVDFWTYSCINSVRSIPFLKNLYQKYNKHGLEIISVHSPEFNFEKNIYNIKKEIDRFEIPYPVVVDNNHKMWTTFNNVYLPSYYLYCIDRKLRFAHFGEDHYSRIEENIIKLLRKPNYLINANESDYINLPNKERTIRPEIYTGHNRINGLSCYEKISPNIASKYTPLNDLESNKLGLDGIWTFYSDRVALNSFQGKIMLTFKAESINIIAGAKNSVRTEIKLNGKPLSLENKGSSIDENSELLIKDYRLYNLVEANKKDLYTLELLFYGKEIEVFAFSFG